MLKRKDLFLDYGAKGLIISLVVFIFLFKTKILIFSIFPFLIAIGLASQKYSSEIKSYNQYLFVFLDDLKDLLLGGMNIVTALEILSENDYGSLSEIIKRISAQVSIGVPFEAAIEGVFSEIESPMFAKVAQVISESTRYGGNLIKVFESVSNYVKTIDEMNLARKSKTFSTIFSSYFMFFVFIAIILIIQIVFLPLMSSGSLTQSSGLDQNQNLKNTNFNTYFLYLILIQGIFAGPMIGKISESSAIAGIKHSIILLSISIPIYVTVSLLFIK
ncbi:MAG: type II secretion system F family protein [archaeon]